MTEQDWLTSTDPAPLLEYLRGRAPDEESFAQAGAIAAEHCRPVADQRGPEDYKRHLVAELTTRALRRAAGRAAARVSQPK